MNIEVFRYVEVVADAGSLSKAAQILYVAQPNLSKSIKEIEAVLGYKLFERTARGMELTEKGREFVKHARLINGQLKEISLLKCEKTSISRNFKISIPRGSYIADAYTNFVREVSKLKINLTLCETNTNNTIENIDQKGFDLGIIRFKESASAYYEALFKAKELEEYQLWDFQYVVVMSKDHPLASKDRITYDDLQDYIEILQGDEINPYDVLPGMPENRTICGRNVIYVYDRENQFNILSDVPETYMFVSPIPEKYLQRYDLILKKCDEKMEKIRDCLIYKKGKQYDEIEKSLLHQILHSKLNVSMQLSGL